MGGGEEFFWGKLQFLSIAYIQLYCTLLFLVESISSAPYTRKQLGDVVHHGFPRLLRGLFVFFYLAPGTFFTHFLLIFYSFCFCATGT